MTAERTYLSWLRYALWGGCHPELAEGSLSEVLELANRQKTRGLVFEAMLRCGAALPEETAARMKELLLCILSAHQMLDAAVAQALGTLRQAGIPAVLLKGQGAARNYPDPQLRECGDIDIYIGPERLEEAVRVLTPLADKVDDELLGKHWELWIGQAELELHQHTMLLPWQLFGCIAVHDLGLPEHELPFYDPARYDKSRRVLAIILSEGNFGRGKRPRRERPKGYLAGKAYSLHLHIIRFLQMFRIAPGEAWRSFVATIFNGFGRIFKDLRHK